MIFDKKTITFTPDIVHIVNRNYKAVSRTKFNDIINQVPQLKPIDSKDKNGRQSYEYIIEHEQINGKKRYSRLIVEINKSNVITLIHKEGELK
ncbi:hypothetical protein ING2D1G_0350 [Peptoniphilus sp. ING2-D1G]|nr:hypothetical protein ING2D1G_0350 [Peptoniphilus sp. ING2-D1G]